MAVPALPVKLEKGDVTLEATTAAEYVDLVYGRGFTEKELTPAEKAARTRAANKASEEQSDQDTSNVPEGATDPAGDATGDES